MIGQLTYQSCDDTFCLVNRVLEQGEELKVLVYNNSKCGFDWVSAKLENFRYSEEWDHKLEFYSEWHLGDLRVDSIVGLWVDDGRS